MAVVSPAKLSRLAASCSVAPGLLFDEILGVRRPTSAASRNNPPPTLGPVDNLRRQHEWQLMDFCCALAMDEAAGLRRRLPLGATEWEWVPNATRVAIPEVAGRNGYTIPKSIVSVEATVEMRAAAIRDLTPLAREIVPTHDQAVAFYRWFETVTKLQAGGDMYLDRVALPKAVRKTLRSMPFAFQTLHTEVERQEEPYFTRHGDRGGWTELSVIIDWTFFIHVSQLLEQNGAQASEVVRALTVTQPGPALLTLADIRSLAEDH
jgi:hypothetical protein